MTVPATTEEYPNLNDSGIFTDQSVPVDIDDQHNLLFGSRFDGVDDYKTSSEEPSVVGDEEVTLGFWMKTNDAGSGFMFAQRLNSLGVGDGTWDISVNNGKVGMAMRDGNNTGIGESASTEVFKTDVWEHVICAGTVSGGTVNIDIYRNGVETSYAIQDSKTGTISAMGSSGAIGPLTVGALNPNGDSPHTDDLSRLKVWRVKLTSAQALEEFNNECAAAFVQIPTVQDNDLRDGWAEFSAPVDVDDQHNLLSAKESDGVDDRMNIVPSQSIIDTNTTNFSGSFWIKAPTQGGQRVICVTFNEFNSTEQNKGGLFIFADATGAIGAKFTTDAANSVQSISVANTVDGDIFRHVGYTCNGNDINLYVDGVEVDYAPTFQNKIQGAGFSNPAGVPNTMKLFNVGINPITSFDGIISRPKWWNDLTLSSCQVQKEFDNEFALIASGFPVLGNEEHLYLMNEAGGALIDTIGSKNTTEAGGAPTFDPTGEPPSVTMDGVDDSRAWTFTSSPIDGSLDYTIYFSLRFLDDLDGIISRVVFQNQNPSTGTRGLSIKWDDLAVTNKLRFSTAENFEVGSDFLDLDIGREFAADETVVLAISFQAWSNQVHVALKTGAGLVLSGSQVQSAIAQDNKGLILGFNFSGTEFYNNQYFKIGAQRAFHSLAELEAAVDALVEIVSNEENVRRNLYLLGVRDDRNGA